MPGKEVVQLYFSAPEGQLDKPYQELGGYAKTDLLDPGQSQQLTISYAVTEMSSYDEDMAAYIMEAGDYVIRIGSDSRNTEPVKTMSLDRTIITEQLSNQMPIDSEGSAVGGAKNGRQFSMPYVSEYDITPEQGKENYEKAAEEFIEENKTGEAYNDGKDIPEATLSLDADIYEQTENFAYPKGVNENVSTYVSESTPTEGRDISGFNYQTLKAYDTDEVTFDGNYSEATLKDVYDGAITLEQFVSGMTIEELTNMVEGGSKSTKPAGQSGGGMSPETLELSEEDDAEILSRFVPDEAGESCGLYTNSKMIPNIVFADGPAGVRVSQSFEEDGTTYYQFATAYPVGQNTAQTWNTELLCEEGTAIGQDMQNAGVDIWLAPGMNIHRNPLCGRNFEYYSEDPMLSGTMAAAIIKGVQSIPGRGVTIKHFACNEQENNRGNSNSVVSERALREIYLKQFEIAVKEAQPLGVMTSYGIINNVGASDNYDLLENILRKEWGFQGFVVTDWGGAGGSSDARSMHAGNDLIMSGHEVSGYMRAYITDAAPTFADGGYPYTFGWVRIRGDASRVYLISLWGDYEPSADGTEYAVETTLSEFDNSQIKQKGDNEVLLKSAHEILDEMKEDGTADYQIDGDKVTITYKLKKISDKDNRSTQVAKADAEGKQEPSVNYDILGNPDYNTLTLADLQKSNIRILNAIMHTGNFFQKIGVEGTAYNEDMEAYKIVLYMADKGEIY